MHTIQPHPIGHGISPAGTPGGDQLKDAFVADLLDLMVAPEFLWIAQKGDTTTSTTLDRNADTITWDATVASRLSGLGSGMKQNFDNSNDEGDSPDSSDHSFGNSQADDPFTVFALVEADDATPAADATIISKWNEDTDGQLREWRFLLSGTNGYPRLELYDESANAYIGREDQTAITVDTWTMLSATHDGSGANTGINVQVDAVVLDDADSSSGTYVAMENTTAVLSIAHNLSAASTPVAEGFWDGDMACIGICRSALSIETLWAIKKLFNSYYDLSL
tara:strand:+ start:11 stop:847 length:837 start_codon:yes stop_codon:yes gene_type:complete